MRVLNMISQAVKLGIPRPIGVDMMALMQDLSLEVLDPEIAHAQELVNAELVKLVHHDSVEYPSPLPGTTKAGALELLYEVPDDDALEAAMPNLQLWRDFPLPMLIIFVKVSFKILNLFREQQRANCSLMILLRTRPSMERSF